jgi:hypothetical protein
MRGEFRGTSVIGPLSADAPAWLDFLSRQAGAGAEWMDYAQNDGVSNDQF